MTKQFWKSLGCCFWIACLLVPLFLQAQDSLPSYQVTRPIDGLIIANDSKGEENHAIDPERICPRFTSGRTGLMNLRGEWVVPMGGHRIGVWGHGWFWLCDGGRIEKYCSEPHHLEGGRYALANATGIVVDSLDDIAIAPEEGFSLLYRDGKIAVMDTTGRFLSGFEYDRAVYWGLPRYTYPDEPVVQRLWIAALRRDGKWTAVLPGGKLQPLDWPSELGTDLRTLGWRKRPEEWFFDSFRLQVLNYPLSPSSRRARPLQPKDLSWEENFPGAARSAQFVRRLRDQDLAAMGLHIVEKDGLRALANARGKPLTAFWHADFMAAPDGFVYQLDSVQFPPPAKKDEFETAPKPYSWIHPADGSNSFLSLLSGKGREILPSAFKDIAIYEDLAIIEVDYFDNLRVFDYSGKILDVHARMLEHGKEYFLMNSDSSYALYDKRHRLVHQDTMPMYTPEIVDGWLWFTDTQLGNCYFARQLKGNGLRGPIYADSLPYIEYDMFQAHPALNCYRCDLQPLETGHWLVMQGDSVGICDAQGKVLLPAIYDEISLDTDQLWVRLGGLEGIADMQGHFFIAIEYERIVSLGDDGYEVAKFIDGKRLVGKLDRAGKRIKELAPQE